MKRGEVRWYIFAAPDKRRQVLILTRDSALAYLNEVTVAPITRMHRAVPSQVFLSTDEGLPQDSAVNLYHIQTVPQSKVGRLITTLAPGRMTEVEAAIRFALGFAELRDR